MVRVTGMFMVQFGIVRRVALLRMIIIIANVVVYVVVDDVINVVIIINVVVVDALVRKRANAATAVEQQ